MQKPRKRKHLELQNQPHSSAKKKSPAKDPYPTHHRPTPDDCRAVRDSLLAHHGFPQEFAKYRNQRPTPDQNGSSFAQGAPKPDPLEKDDPGCDFDEEESVLDGLVRTVLSQNTTEVNSQRAFLSLKSAFPNWENVSL